MTDPLSIHVSNLHDWLSNSQTTVLASPYGVVFRYKARSGGSMAITYTLAYPE